MPDDQTAQSSEKTPILLNPEHKEIHAAVGQAVDAYAHLEGSLEMLLEAILETTPLLTTVIFSAVQNVRSRNEMFQSLLKIKYGNQYVPYWSRCRIFLEKLAAFRNAIVHWWPCVTIYKDKKGKTVKHAHELMPPSVSGSDSFLNIRVDDIPAFIKDCRYIEQEVFALVRAVRGEAPEPASPDRFLRPSIRPNQAVIRLHRTAKAPQPRPKSSLGAAHPKQALSSKQRRTRALAIAAKAKVKPKNP